MTYQLWQHQKQSVDMIKNERAVMLGLDMGTGKSLCVIDYLNNVSCPAVLIVCPLSVIPAWGKQFRLYSGIVPTLTSGNIAQKTDQAKLALLKKSPIIINYESAWREPFRSFALNTKWSLVVADESHKIKSPSSKVSWFFKALGQRAEKRIGLTGTPLPHSALDAYAQFRFLDPEIFGKSFNLFKNQYCVMGGFQNHEVKAFKNMDSFNRKFHSITKIVRKEDVLDLPDTIHEERFFEMSPEAKRVYKNLKRDFVSDLQNGIVTTANALTRLLKFQQITSGWVQDTEGRLNIIDTGKLDTLTDLLDDIPADQPLVIFARFHNDVDFIAGACLKAGRTVCELSGRNNELQDWQDGRGNTIVVQIQAGGVGIDLTRSHYCIYYSIGFSLAEYEQSLARLHRPGQNNKVTYFHLTCQNSIDERIYESLEAKKDAIEEILIEWRRDHECREIKGDNRSGQPAQSVGGRNQGYCGAAGVP